MRKTILCTHTLTSEYTFYTDDEGFCEHCLLLGIDPNNASNEEILEYIEYNVDKRCDFDKLTDEIEVERW